MEGNEFSPFPSLFSSFPLSLATFSPLILRLTSLTPPHVNTMKSCSSGLESPQRVADSSQQRMEVSALSLHSTVTIATVANIVVTAAHSLPFPPHSIVSIRNTRTSSQ
ncbi:hypothetical protein E2C01_045530 [Portunus trituberculatus]|uniref:Uncharacterized protein n=1 Tax=Portunus trituberculatus TaxID=210409 RepID=A0A5B7G3D7_PORTR|nr:hypothetical protein [Portunus trituberculatus]